jgi:hypothetical protein
VDEEWNLRTITIGFKHFDHTKTGHNLRQFVKTVLTKELDVKPFQVVNNKLTS